MAEVNKLRPGQAWRILSVNFPFGRISKRMTVDTLSDSADKENKEEVDGDVDEAEAEAAEDCAEIN